MTTLPLIDKLLKNSTLEYAATLLDSKIYNKKDMIPTNIPMINVMLSGRVDGGLSPGLTTIAGNSKNFKSGFALLLSAAFLRKYPDDGVILFYDSEFGTPPSYIKAAGIPFNAVLHSPVTDIEMLKFDLMQQLNGADRSDHIMIIVDSLGNLASRKETEDALAGKSTADMTRAKQIKSLFRMVTPHLTLKDIPMIVINHVYKEMGLFPKDIISGGSGPYLDSDNIWIVGRQQDKDEKTKEIEGYHFIINIEKSRYVKEKSKIPITISYERGINKWSGLFDTALNLGYIDEVAKGWYTSPNFKTTKFRASEIVYNDEFWMRMMENQEFTHAIRDKFALPETINE